MDELLDDFFLEKEIPYKDEVTLFERCRVSGMELMISAAFTHFIFIILSIFFGINMTGDDHLISLTVITFYFINKDMFKGQSFLKRHGGLIVIDTKTQAPASAIKCLLRNFSLILWPLEIMVLMYSPSRRIGDYLVGTKVMNCPTSNFNNMVEDIKEFRFISIRFFITLILGLLFTYYWWFGL